MAIFTRCSASFSAIPRPMPRELPVIRACFTSGGISTSSCLSRFAPYSTQIGTSSALDRDPRARAMLADTLAPRLRWRVRVPLQKKLQRRRPAGERREAATFGLDDDLHALLGFSSGKPRAQELSSSPAGLLRHIARYDELVLLEKSPAAMQAAQQAGRELRIAQERPKIGRAHV